MYKGKNPKLTHGEWFLFVSVLVLVLVFVQCVPTYAYEFSKQTDNIVTALLKKDYGDALDKSRALEKNTHGQIKAEALYFQGMTLMSLIEYSEARGVFEQALSYSQGDLTVESYIGIADTYFKQYLFEKAINVYSQVLTNYKNSNNEAILLYKIGRSYQKNSEWLKANDYFKQLLEKYPNSLEVGLLEKNSSGGNFFTIEVGAFSKQSSAQQLFNDLQQKGYETHLIQTQDSGYETFRIRVGKFVSRIAAEFEEEKIRNNEALPTRVIP